MSSTDLNLLAMSAEKAYNTSRTLDEIGRDSFWNNQGGELADQLHIMATQFANAVNNCMTVAEAAAYLAMIVVDRNT